MAVSGSSMISNLSNLLYTSNSRKTDLQCRERFCNILDPKLLRKPGPPTDKMLDIIYYVIFGKKCAWLAEHVTIGLTDNDVLRQLKNFMDKFPDKFKEICSGNFPEYTLFYIL